MKIHSLAYHQNQLIPVEVELALVSGLPQMHFLGLPDQHLKESIPRIKAAIEHQGFSWPKAQQILVNIRPSYIKKTSRGLELAVAAALLWETGQLPTTDLDIKSFFYGELNLNGDVLAPDDLWRYQELKRIEPVYTGQSSHVNLPFLTAQVSSLKNLSEPVWQKAKYKKIKWERPPYGLNLEFSQSHAELLKIVAYGGHSLMLAGPAGSGKTTLALSVASFLPEPNSQESLELERSQLIKNQDLKWRPIIKPHHSITTLAMVGGGSPLFFGEITRAHKGILILDELLEFNRTVQEALREPMQEGLIRITRAGKSQTYPAQAQVIATTNLCPCGDYVPKKPVRCYYSLKRCRSYLEKLSGPIVDRFQMLAFTKNENSKNKILGSEILSQIERAQEFRQKNWPALGACSRQDLKSIKSRVDSFTIDHLLPESGSLRRTEAILRVAASVADLAQSVRIDVTHLEKAKDYTYTPFMQLKYLQ